MSSKMLRCMAYRDGSFWVAVCLDLCLAAQGSSPEEVIAKLNSQIDDYVSEALNDKEYGYQLLNRRAPPSLWMKYYYLKVVLYFAANDKQKPKPSQNSTKKWKLFDIDSGSGCHVC